MSLGEDIRARLLADATIRAAVGGQRVHRNTIPQTKLGTRIWFSRAGVEHEDVVSDGAGVQPFRERFDLEVIGDDLDDVDTTATAVRALHKITGTFGAGTIQRMFVTDHQDDYVPRGVGTDEGAHVAAMQLEITGYLGA